MAIPLTGVTMEFLFKDKWGFSPPYSHRLIDNTEWISPNADCSNIPLEACEYKDKMREVISKEAGVGPNGTFLEMDWALEPAWYNCTLHWEAWIPTGLLIPNHMQFSLPPIHEESSGCIIDTCHAEDLIEAITESWNAIMAIMNIYPYQDSNTSPAPFDCTLLWGWYSSPEAAVRVRTDAVRAILSYTGFLIWWTSSIHDWMTKLPELTIYKTRQLVNSCGTQQCGVLVDLQKDWRGISLAHWIVNSVPVYYPWNWQIASVDHFLRLSPTILSATIPSPPHDRDSDIIMAGTSISEQVKTTLALYNEFLQEIELPDDNSSNPLLNNNNFPIYWIVDFQGWECRPLDNIEVTHKYSLHYHWASKCNSVQKFTIWRFHPRYTSALVLGAGIKRSGATKDCQWSDWEICELYKGSLAPRQGERFNLGG